MYTQVVKVFHAFLFIGSPHRVVIEIKWKNILCLQHVLDWLYVVLLVEHLRVLLQLSHAHVSDTWDHAFDLAVDFDEIGNRHAREVLYLNALLLRPLLERLMLKGHRFDELLSHPGLVLGQVKYGAHV